ncbi:MAG: hypothetical protein J0647_00765 [Campylobacteraceae bacterium]|nr:hypothetical protein [Campylobacteraceae bacterium]
MSCYLHANAESTNQCESCGVDLCDDCSTRFEELKCANCMKKAIMARRIRYGIGLVVAIIAWLIVYSKTSHMGRDASVLLSTVVALIAFSLSHGLSDYRSAMRNVVVQKSLNSILEYYKKGMASAKGEQLMGAVIGIVMTIFISIYFALIAVVFGIVIFAIGSLFRRTILLIKEFKVDTSL